jgi:hypothetical protein
MRDTHDQLQAKFLSNPENKAEYDKSESEYKAINEQLKNKLYNSKIANDRKWIIDNFDAVLDKYILKLDNVYNLDGNLTLDVEWEEINPWDKNPSTQTIAEGLEEMILDCTPEKIQAWAFIRGYLSGFEFAKYDDKDLKQFKQMLNEYKGMLIDELLERNDWEFLKEREVTGE